MFSPPQLVIQTLLFQKTKETNFNYLTKDFQFCTLPQTKHEIPGPF